MSPANKAIIAQVEFNQKRLVDRVEFLVNKDNLRYLDALMQVCEETGLDHQDIAKLVKGPLRARVEAEAIASHGVKPKKNAPSEEFIVALPGFE